MTNTTATEIKEIGTCTQEYSIVLEYRTKDKFNYINCNEDDNWEQWKPLYTYTTMDKAIMGFKSKRLESLMDGDIFEYRLVVVLASTVPQDTIPKKFSVKL